MIFENFDFSRALSAAFLAFIAMSAMIAGTLAGIFGRPSQRSNAIIMAFGTGALIQALTIDLAYHGAFRLMESNEHTGAMAWGVVSLGFILGGLAYYLGNRVLDNQGAAIRQPALAKFYFLKKKRSEKAEILKQLSNVKMMRSLPPEEMELILDAVVPIAFPEGTTIFRKGDKADGLYIILEGEVNIMDTDDPAKPHIAILGQGDSFGEMALLNREPRYASAVTAGPARLLKIHKEQFDNLISASPLLRQSVEQLNRDRLIENVQSGGEQMDKEHWMKIALSNIDRLSKTEEYMFMHKNLPKGAPLAIFLGALMDVIPESVVIGAGFTDFSNYQYTFVAAVFLANFPEAMASSNAMLLAGFSKTRIFKLWGIAIISGIIAAVLGNVFLVGVSPILITLVEAVAGGAILAMVASVMMPEAYEDGGSEVGLATIAGFLVAFLFTLV